jgi:hypothetical protein
MSRYGIWYDDGRIDLGWLHFEGSHGRPQRCEYDTVEEAREEAVRQGERDMTSVFEPLALDTDDRECSRIVSRIAKQARVRRAEQELGMARQVLALEEDEGT